MRVMATFRSCFLSAYLPQPRGSPTGPGLRRVSVPKPLGRKAVRVPISDPFVAAEAGLILSGSTRRASPGDENGEEVSQPDRQARWQSGAHAPDDGFHEPGEARRTARHHLLAGAEKRG